MLCNSVLVSWLMCIFGVVLFMFWLNIIFLV